MCLDLQHFYTSFNTEHFTFWNMKLILMLSVSALSRGQSSLYVNRSPPVSAEIPDCSLKAQPLLGDPLTSVAWALHGKQLPDQHAAQVWLVFLLNLHTSIKKIHWTTGPSREKLLSSYKIYWWYLERFSSYSLEKTRVQLPEQCSINLD